MSKIEVNTVEPQCGTTLTLGASGDTVALASGASQSGFGRTGTVDWQTTPKTGDFTGANGEGYFINTTSSEITMTLPSASAGDIISIQDYNNTFDSNSFTVQAGSGVKINGGTAAGKITLSTEGQGLTLIYVDATVGWRSIESTTFSSQSIVPTIICAAGGTITTSPCGNDKIHTFTGPGTFTVNSISNVADNNEVSYVIVAGGGGSAGFKPCSPAGGSGGGGAGGYRESKSPVTPYTASPLDGRPNSPNRITVTATSFPIAVGGGGAQGPRQAPGGQGTSGGVATFSSITSAGGGGGSNFPGPGIAGGSGGGGRGACQAAGAGNTPSTSPAQGFPGGVGGATGTGGGGGGATAAGAAGLTPGSPGPISPTQGGPGGAGATSSINGTPTARAGGGGGSTGPSPLNNPGGVGGAGGGGNGGLPGSVGQCGTANTGGGGGGAKATGTCEPGTNGGSGIVIIRYRFQ